MTKIDDQNICNVTQIIAVFLMHCRTNISWLFAVIALVQFHPSVVGY